MKRIYRNKPEKTFKSDSTISDDSRADGEDRYVTFPSLRADGMSEPSTQETVPNDKTTRYQAAIGDNGQMGFQKKNSGETSDMKDERQAEEASSLRGEHSESVPPVSYGNENEGTILSVETPLSLDAGRFPASNDRGNLAEKMNVKSNQREQNQRVPPVIRGSQPAPKGGIDENINVTTDTKCQYTERDCIKGQNEQPTLSQNSEGADDYKEGSQGAPAAPPNPPGASPPDGGWGWMVCVTCLWVNGTVMGTVNSFGILYDYMYKLYAQGNEEVSLKTSFVGACMNGVMFLMCCVSGILCDVIGLRQTALIGGFLCVLGFFSSAFVSQLELLYLTYGVLLGSGFGLVFSPMVAITGHYFKKKLGMVNGIVTFGASAFTVAMSFALPYVLNYFGLKATLLGYAGLGVTLTLCTLAWRPLVSREYVAESEDRGKTSALKHCMSFVTRKLLNGRVWKNRKFLCWSLAMAISRFGYLEPYFHMVSHVSHVLPGSNASILITIMAAVSGVSKLIVGKLSDLIRQYRIYLQQGALLGYGVIVICFPFSATFPGYIVMAVFLGFADAIIMALYGPNAIELVGPGNAAQAIGFASLLGIPTFLSAPSITGAMHDHFKTYNLGFHVTGAITLLSSFLMCLVANPFHEKIQSKAPVSGQPSNNPSPVGNDNDYKIPIDSSDNANRDGPAYINNAYEWNEVLNNQKIETRL